MGDKKVQAKAVTMDFSKLENEGQWKQLQSELAGLDIGVLGELLRLRHPWLSLHFERSDARAI